MHSDGANEYRFRLKAVNGEIILASEGCKYYYYYSLHIFYYYSLLLSEIIPCCIFVYFHMFCISNLFSQLQWIYFFHTDTAKSSALAGIDSVRSHVTDITNFQLKEVANGEFYFVLVANNNEPIGVSELYSSSGARAIGQYAVERAAPGAPVTDLTLGQVAARKARFTLYRNLAGEFRWRLQAPNYRTILHSEGYTSKQAAQNGIQSVRTNSVMDVRYAKLESSDGQFYFNLRAGNNEVIGTSELCEWRLFVGSLSLALFFFSKNSTICLDTTTAARDNGIASVTTNAPDAELIDNVLPNKPQPRFELYRDAPTGLKWKYRLKVYQRTTPGVLFV